MTKNDILLEVTRSTNLTFSQATSAYDAIISAIKRSLIKNEDVTLRGFATLKVMQRKERISGLHKKKMVIPACKVVKFKTCKELKQQMNNE